MAKQEQKTEEIEIVQQEEDLSPRPAGSMDEKILQALSPYVAFLEAMKTNKRHTEVAPTFTPKTFYEQVQFYDDGVNRRLYLYINGDWRYVALT